MRMLYVGVRGYRGIGYERGKLSFNQNSEINGHAGWPVSRCELTTIGLRCIIAAIKDNAGRKQQLNSEAKLDRDMRLIKWIIVPIFLVRLLWILGNRSERYYDPREGQKHLKHQMPYCGLRSGDRIAVGIKNVAQKKHPCPYRAPVQSCKREVKARNFIRAQRAFSNPLTPCA